MSDNIKIVPATEADLPSIKPLISELRDVLADTGGIDAGGSLENCAILINDPGHHIFLAKDKDVVAGLINFTTRMTILHTGPSALIDELIVSERYRGHGIGSKLISSAVEKCRELGCGEVEVSTEKGNTGAREFYKKCGFEEDAVLLELALEE